jgi:hypothetical protein
MVPKTQLDEFRNNNIALIKERDDLKKAYEGVDVVKYRELLAAAGKTPQEIEDAVKARVKQLTDEHTVTVTDLNNKLSTTQQQLNTVLVDGTLKAEAAKAGVLVTALDDVVLRGRQVFSTADGKMIAKNERGEALYDKDGQSPLQVTTWLKDLKKGAPHLFEGMRGAGAPGSGSGPGGLDMSKATATQKIQAGLALQRQGQGG